jgi:2-polyprenyl-3-methyl-5-hydroxy-6-metoxy-1,4-benzoquinol methylase
MVGSHISARFRSIDESGLESVKTALIQHYFSKQAPDYLDTEHGKRDLRDHLTTRLERARTDVIPWLNAARPLAGSRILEIGTGTGSDLVALAEQGADVVGLELDADSLRVAEQRADAYGVQVTLIQSNAMAVSDLFPLNDFDFIIFFASLEHMVHTERLQAMAGTWAMLQPNAFWCVVETPNRLWYQDVHTSWLPFFQWLPDDLAFKYSRFSSRFNFGGDFYPEETEDRMLHFLRRGRGVSFHEFSLAMQPAETLNVVSYKTQFHARRRPRWPWRRPSRDQRYEALLSEICPRVHAAFFQPYLDLIIRKP